MVGGGGGGGGGLYTAYETPDNAIWNLISYNNIIVCTVSTCCNTSIDDTVGRCIYLSNYCIYKRKKQQRVADSGIY